MTDSRPALEMTIFEFGYRVTEPLLTESLASIWHGVFGKALKEAVCIRPTTPCAQCLLLHQCAYPQVFSSIGNPASERHRGKSIPVPHVFRLPGITSNAIPASETFVIKLIIMGNAIRYRESIVRAMVHAGAGGLGRSRSRLELSTVRHLNTDNETLGELSHEYGLANFQPCTIIAPKFPTEITMTFLTSYQPTGKHRESKMNVSRCLMGIIRRVSLMQECYSDAFSAPDFGHLKSLTQNVEIKSEQFYPTKSQRYSARHKNNIDTSGWCGQATISLTGNEQLWPYLWLGQFTGVGKNASMSMGHYELA